MYIVCLFFYLSPAAQPPAQADPKKDSLVKEVAKAKNDTSRVLALYTLGMYILEYGNTAELLTTGNEMLTLSVKNKYARGEGLGNLILAWYYYRSAKPDENYAYIKRARELLQKSYDQENYGQALLQQIRLSNSMTNTEEALMYCKLAEPIFLKQNKKMDLYDLYMSFGRSYFNTSDFLRALEYHLKTEKIALQLGDEELLAACYQNIAASFEAQHEDSMAIVYIQKALAINTKLPNRFWALFSNKYLLANINCRNGKYREALSFMQSIFDYFNKQDTANRVPLRCQILGWFGNVYEQIGDSASAANNIDYAQEYWQKSLDYYHEGHKRYVTFYKGLVSPYLAKGVGSTFLKTGNIPQARLFLNTALDQGKKINNKGMLAEIYFLLSKCDSVTGDYKSAFTNIRNYHLYHDSITLLEKSKAISYYKAQIEYEKKESELQALITENKLKTSLANQQKQKRKMAYALSGLIMLGTGYGVFRYRKFNKQKSEQRSLKERLAISQDLHDHVGSTLSSISVFSKVAQMEGEKGNSGQMNVLLDRIRSTSGKMMTEMNDIVWAINPQNDTMEKIIQRMESFARPLLAARNMQFHFNYDESAKSVNLEMEQRKNFFLIFKEAVNNAIKYSGGSLLQADILYKQDMLELSVKDNGVGFNISRELNETKSLSGNGLRNMQARAKTMNANFQILSEPGKGTSIRLILPLM